MRTRPAWTLGAALTAAVLASGCTGEVFQPTHTGVVPLDGQSHAGQTFRAPSDQVTRVDVLVATYGRPADPQGTLSVTLLEAPGGTELASTRVRGDALEDNTWVAARFADPVDVGSGAAVELGWDGAEPIALRANVPPAGNDEDRLLNDPYRGGELLRDGAPATGDLAFRVVGATGPGEAATEIARWVRTAASRLTDRPLFAAAWLLLVTGAAALALAPLRRRRA